MSHLSAHWLHLFCHWLSHSSLPCVSYLFTSSLLPAPLDIPCVTQLTASPLACALSQVVVAHRLSTVLDADLVIVLSHGRVVESGTHASLAQREGGLYARMWAHQQEHGAEDIDALARRFENTAEGAGAGAGEGPREGQS